MAAGRPLLSEHVTNHGRKTFVIRIIQKIVCPVENS